MKEKIKPIVFLAQVRLGYEAVPAERGQLS